MLVVAEAYLVSQSLCVFSPKKLFVKPNTTIKVIGKEGDLIETFEGKKYMKVCEELTYLGVEISSDGRYMKTILRKRNKNIGKKTDKKSYQAIGNVQF